MPFDVDGALAAGASEDDVLGHLTQTRPYDVDGALQAGATKQQIIGYLAAKPPKQPTQPGQQQFGAGGPSQNAQPDFPGAAHLSPQQASKFTQSAHNVTGESGETTKQNTFFGSAYDAMPHPIEAIKQYFKQGPPALQQMHAAEQGELTSPEQGGNILTDTAAPAMVAGSQAASGNLKGAAGTLVGGYAIPAAAGYALGKTLSAIRETPTATQSSPQSIPKEHLQMVQALRPRAGQTSFVENLNRSMPDLKAAESALGRPISSVDDLLGTPEQPGVIAAAKKANRAQYAQMTGPQYQIGTTVDLSPVADAMTSSISRKMRLENPQAAARVEQMAAQYRQRVPLEDAEDFLRTTNSELEGYYGRNPAARQTSVAANPDTALLNAQAKAIRQQIYQTLDAPGQGTAARELQRRYGALMEIEDAALQRRNVALRQVPVGLSEQVSRWSSIGQAAKGAAKLATGNISGAADVASAMAQSKYATWLKQQQTTDALIARSFRSYRQTPQPINIPTPPQPAGLLGPGAYQMPPTADTSGSVPFEPQRNPGYWNPAINPKRPAALPAGPIITPPPADTSGIRVTSGKAMAPPARQLPAPSRAQTPGFAVGSDMIPVWSKSLGRYEYVPKWTQQGGPTPYSVGGMVNQPTDAVIGENGPEMRVPLGGTVPEDPRTLSIQMGQLQNGQRRAVLFPRGTPIPERPDGLKQVSVRDGMLYYQPGLVKPSELISASKTGRLNDVLGAADGGMGPQSKGDIAATGQPPLAVIGKAADGTTAQGTLASPDQVAPAVAQTAKVTPPGGRVSVENPVREIRRRIRAGGHSGRRPR